MFHVSFAQQIFDYIVIPLDVWQDAEGQNTFYKKVDNVMQKIPHENHRTSQNLNKSADYISNNNDHYPWFFVGDGVNGAIVFEGDGEVCKTYDYTTSQTLRDAGFGICKQAAALEYCYRHGTELLLMNDEIKPVFDDLCYSVENKDIAVNPLKTSISSNAYWKNVRRDPYPVTSAGV